MTRPCKRNTVENLFWLNNIDFDDLAYREISSLIVTFICIFTLNDVIQANHNNQSLSQ